MNSQTMEGFGASGAWWTNDLNKFPLAVKQEVASALFTSQPSALAPNGGIALSGYRYNIGGGGVGVTTPDRAQPLPTEKADPGGLWFLKAAANAGVPELTGFVNSAPARFTSNTKSCGGTLPGGNITAFANYLTNVVSRISAQDGVALTYVSPMNEPDNNFGSCSQEGMSVPVSERGQLVQTLGNDLATLPTKPKVIADETSAVIVAAINDPTWINAAGSKERIAAVAHHTYDFPTASFRRNLHRALSGTGLASWMTEICCYKGSGGMLTSFGSQYDPTITQGLWLADEIAKDLLQTHDSAWYWWTALSPVMGCDPAVGNCATKVNQEGSNDGLLYYNGSYGGDPNLGGRPDYTLTTTKRFFVLGQFSRFVPVGSVLHEVTGTPPGVRALAFHHGSSWSFITWNDGASASNFSVALPARNLSATSATVTSVTQSLAPSALPTSSGTNAWAIALSPHSIMSVTFTAH